MGAPKQKWTAEEEAALKAGMRKHGTGKWRAILSDPEFSTILHSRSNVDLKDKWRNINVTAIWGSRQKAKLALKRNQVTPKQDGQTQLKPKRDGLHKAVITVPPNGEEVVDAKPLVVSSEPLRASVSKEPSERLDKLILEAISNLKKPSGSDRASIAHYIEEKYLAPANLKKSLATKLKFLTAKGTLIKIKHKYMIAPSETVPVTKKYPELLLEGSQKSALNAQMKDINSLKAQIDADLSKMRGMTAKEAAAAAAKAIEEAEIAIAEAEEAAREAEKAEAEAEAAQNFAKEAMKALKNRKRCTW